MEWVLAAYLGIAHTASAPVSITQPAVGTSLTFSDVNFAGRSLSKPLYYGYRAAYFPSPDAAIGVEAEMIHLKAYADTSTVARVTGTHGHRAISGAAQVGGILQQLSISHGLNLLFANIAARRTLVRRHDHKPLVRVAARLGVGPTLPHPESTVDGLSHDGYEWGALAVQTAAGLEVRLYRGIAATAEYKFTRTDQNITIDQGEVRGVFASHHMVFGVAWHTK